MWIVFCIERHITKGTTRKTVLMGVTLVCCDGDRIEMKLYEHQMCKWLSELEGDCEIDIPHCGETVRRALKDIEHSCSWEAQIRYKDVKTLNWTVLGFQCLDFANFMENEHLLRYYSGHLMMDFLSRIQNNEKNPCIDKMDVPMLERLLEHSALN